MIFKRTEIDTIVPIPESLFDAIELVKSDYYRYYGNKVFSFGACLMSLMRNPSFAFVFWLRLSSVNWFGRSLAKFIKTVIGRKRGLQISEYMPIGYGFFIAHAFGTIINPSAVIGNNVTISQFTTIGAIKGVAAIIGNNVYIGLSVCIVEKVKIWNNTSIGAGAVVLKDVPENCTVAGVPAKIISKEKKNVINNPFQYEDRICN